MYSFTYLFTYLLGVELLATFERELTKHEKSRQELANAEKLFDLPITRYPELFKVQKEMNGLKMIYELYERLKVSVCRCCLTVGSARTDGAQWTSCQHNRVWGRYNGHSHFGSWEEGMGCDC